MYNPNKQVRRSIIDLLSLETGLPVYHDSIPLDSPLISKYILLSSQSKRKTAQSKDCYDVETSITIHIVSVNEKGFNRASVVDDIESIVIDRMERLKVSGFFVKGREFVDSVSVVVESPDHTVNQTNIIYNLWLSAAN